MKLLLVLIISSYGLGTSASDVRLKIYPMVNRAQIKERITKYEWGRKYLDQSHKNVDKYVNIHVNDPEWIISRIQMYWKKKHPAKLPEISQIIKQPMNPSKPTNGKKFRKDMIAASRIFQEVSPPSS